MAIDRKAIFGKIARAKATGGGNWIKDGTFLLAVFLLELDSKNAGATHVLEADVLESAPSGEKDEKGVPIEPNKPGTRVSWVQLIDKHLSAVGNLKAFYLALDGSSESEMVPDVLQGIIDKATSKEQPFRGMKIRCETYRKQTRDGQKTLVLPRWSFVEQTVEDIAAMRAKMEKGEAAA